MLDVHSHRHHPLEQGNIKAGAHIGSWLGPWTMQMDLFENNMNITLADPAGEGPGGVGTPLLIFRPNWGPKGRKKFFWDRPPLILGSGWPSPPPSPHPYLKVWIRHCINCKGPHTNMPQDVNDLQGRAWDLISKNIYRVNLNLQSRSYYVKITFANMNRKLNSTFIFAHWIVGYILYSTISFSES